VKNLYKTVHYYLFKIQKHIKPIKIKMQKTKQRNQRRKPTISSQKFSGRGDYSTTISAISDPVKRIEKKIDHLEKALVKNPLSKANAAATIGRTLGNFVGQGDLGDLAGSSLAKYFGHGDYAVKSNSLMSSGHTGTVVPKFTQDGKRGTRIIEREFLTNIESSTLFSNTVKNLNPTDPTTFPWLSKIAPLFDQWEPNGIVFEFVSTSSEFNGTSQALGAVIFATDYDPYDPDFSSKQEMENSAYACSTKPSNGLSHGIECDPNERPTNVLYTSTSNGAPLTATSLGRFQTAVQGCSVAGEILGELWVSYDITFYKKQLLTLAGSVLDIDGTASVGTGMFSAPNITQQNTITMTQNVGVGSVLNFNNLLVGVEYVCVQTMLNWDVADPVNFTTFNCTYDYVRGNNLSLTPNSVNTLSVRTTGPGATLTSGLKVVANSTYRLNVSTVSTGFYFI